MVGALALVLLGGLAAFGISTAGFGAIRRYFFGDTDVETAGPAEGAPQRRPGPGR